MLLGQVEIDGDRLPEDEAVIVDEGHLAVGVQAKEFGLSTALGAGWYLDEIE
jgi:hypothetical protein